VLRIEADLGKLAARLTRRALGTLGGNVLPHNMRDIERLDVVIIHSDKGYHSHFTGKEATVIWLDRGYPIAKLFVEETGQYIDILLADLELTDKRADYQSLLGKKYEISTDLVLGNDMAFFQGTYRIPGEFWRLVLAHTEPEYEKVIHKKYMWPTGIETIEVRVPEGQKINLEFVKDILTRYCPQANWELVRGPDSMSFR
jgi:hypothetical protein